MYSIAESLSVAQTILNNNQFLKNLKDDKTLLQQSQAKKTALLS